MLIRAAQVSIAGPGVGFDPELYQRYAREWIAGTAFSVSVPEYPPGAFPIFAVPLLLGGAAGYRPAFALEMAVFDLAACVLVLLIASAQTRRWSGAVGASVVYTLATAALFPVLYARYDLVPAVLVLAAIYALHRRKFALSGALLGAAAGVKLWPAALVPIWLAWTVRGGGRARLASGIAWVAAGVLVVTLPALPAVGTHAFSALRYYSGRGIQVESTWATVALLARYAGIADLRSEFRFGAFEVVGRLSGVFVAIAPAVAGVLALLPQARAIRRWVAARPASPPPAGSFETAALAASIGLLLGSKVLSPQFMIWIAPLLAIVAADPVGISAAIAMMVLTTLVYPYLATSLEQRAPGLGWALTILVCRNALLAGWYVVAMRRQTDGNALAG